MTGIERLREHGDNLQELLEALASDARVEAHAIAEQIKREITPHERRDEPADDHAADVSMSAYDLLPEEERDAIAWVREHGGLGHVKDICHDFRAVVERLGIEWSESELHSLMDVLDKRLMPEGMEWPCFEDGEPVRFGDAFAYGNKTFYVDSVQLLRREFHLWATDGKVVTGSNGERCERPAPKVLDADGAEIRVGDTVYLLPGDWCDKFPCCGYHGNEELEVFSLHADHVEGGIGCRDTRRPRGTCYPQPSQLTHRAPVLAADGRPLREGETVWDVDGRGPLTVWDLPDKSDMHVSLKKDGTFYYRYPENLTHERPDSLGRLAEDVGAMVVAWRSNRDLFDAQEAAAGCVGENTLGDALDSLVSRVKALAERDAK